jgi:hypothetical protein
MDWQRIAGFNGAVKRQARVVAGAVLVGSLVWSSAAFSAAPDLPDGSRTPGVTDPAVTQGNIQNICVAGYTSTLRPNTSVTNAIKKRQLGEWKYKVRAMSHYEEDHLISLQLGGAPDDERNLWPQHYSGVWGARIKDTLEGELNRRICSDASDIDHISLREGQSAISDDWKAAYTKYVCHRRLALAKTMKTHCK